MKEAIHQVTRQMERENATEEVASTDDKLGWTMTFLRAAEGPNVRMGVMQKCVKAYPRLGELVNARSPILDATGEIRKIRDHAVDLSRQSIQEDLNKLQIAQGLDDDQRARRKDNILLRIRRLMPGASTGINAIRSEEGTIHNEASEMAENLKKHWGRTFSRRDINKDKLNK